MKKTNRRWIAWVGLALCLPTLGGCASQRELQNRDQEILALREERTRLKKELHAMELQLDNYEIRLAEANMKLSEAPEPASFPELDTLGIDYGTRGGNMVFSVPSEITFASGKAEVSKTGRAALKTVADTLAREYPNGLYWIEGHTDSDPIKKSKFESNRHLSMIRALRVLHFLVEECGLADDQCVVAGHGEYSPLAGNDSQANKAKNRRVEIVVHTDRN